MTWEIKLGECGEIMATLEAESVDAIVCDPPYALTADKANWRAKSGESFEARPDLAAPLSNERKKRGGFMGKGWDSAIPGPEIWAEALRVAKPGAHLVAFGGTRTYHRLVCAIEDAGWEIRDGLMWLYGSGFPKSLDVSKAIDKAAGAVREVVGKRSTFRESATDPGRDWQDRSDGNITAPATAAARTWAGWGTALKPAWEPIVLARKPSKATVAATVLEHGTGALNVDGCRVESSGRPNIEKAQGSNTAGTGTYGAGLSPGSRMVGATDLGRWPANLVLDEEAAAMLDAQTGESHDGVAGKRNGVAGVTLHGLGPADEAWGGYGGRGGASRFFYTAKASSGERHYAGKNTHPTVKPVDLMQWLVRLVTPKGGLVLDPFCGSGSTGVAALAEGMRFLGIELDPEYVEIAAQRIGGPLFVER